jgi:hypothetical protein
VLPHGPRQAGLQVSANVRRRQLTGVAMAEQVIRKAAGDITLEVRDEPVVEYGVVDRLPQYPRVHNMGEPRLLTSRHAVLSFRGDQLLSSLLLGSSGGPSGVHDRSILVLNNNCFAAVGPKIVALSIPDLDVIWECDVDEATCFGVYAAPDGAALISHGELDIARVTLSGAVVWRNGGADVFTGPFLISTTTVEVCDCNNDRYLFDLETGDCYGGPA